MKTVKLTREMLRRGCNNGCFTKAQCEVFGIPVKNNRKQKKELIGKEVDENIYIKFLSLKRTQFKRKIIKKKIEENKNTVACKNCEPMDFEEVKKFAEGNELLMSQLRSMKYTYFLNTRYWKTVRNKVIELSGGKCSICGNTRFLNVHHKTYKNHGSEIFHLEDLVVLCRNCHEKLHQLT